MSSVSDEQRVSDALYLLNELDPSGPPVFMDSKTAVALVNEVKRLRSCRKCLKDARDHLKSVSPNTSHHIITIINSVLEEEAA